MHPIQTKILNLHQTRKLSTLSYREIGRQISDDSRQVHPQTVKHHLDRLIKIGKLSEADRPVSVSPRNVAASAVPTLISIPVMGAADAGPASLFADDHVKDYIKVSSKLLRSKNYADLIALRVAGDSMNEADVDGKRIEDGDWVIVDRSKQTPRNNEVVVVNEENKVNIKRIVFEPENNQVILQSESTGVYDPIYLGASEDFDAFVEGTVIQVIKG